MALDDMTQVLYLIYTLDDERKRHHTGTWTWTCPSNKTLETILMFLFLFV